MTPASWAVLALVIVVGAMCMVALPLNKQKKQQEEIEILAQAPELVRLVRAEPVGFAIVMSQLLVVKVKE